MNEAEWERVLCGGGEGREGTVVLDCKEGHRWIATSESVESGPAKNEPTS